MSRVEMVARKEDDDDTLDDYEDSGDYEDSDSYEHYDGHNGQDGYNYNNHGPFARRRTRHELRALDK
ncbi:hypothetical protein BGZ73_008644 [Actinomortierella ambigua]|nr:hypothetical protein BGZ73_008644 [Actinomortierella ambigua]